MSVKMKRTLKTCFIKNILLKRLPINVPNLPVKKNHKESFGIVLCVFKTFKYILKQITLVLIRVKISNSISFLKISSICMAIKNLI